VDFSFPNAIVDLKYSTINISNPTIITKKNSKGITLLFEALLKTKGN